MHLLCSDTAAKYRVENGAEERGTVTTINIHSPSTEGWQEPGPRRNLLINYAKCDTIEPLFLSSNCHVLDLEVPGCGCSCATRLH